MLKAAVSINILVLSTHLLVKISYRYHHSFKMGFFSAFVSDVQDTKRNLKLGNEIVFPNIKREWKFKNDILINPRCFFFFFKVSTVKRIFVALVSIIQNQSPRNLFYFATGETGLDRKKNIVAKGLHNWYQFHLEQAAGRLTYTPPPKNAVDTNKKVMASCSLANSDIWKVTLNWFKETSCLNR